MGRDYSATVGPYSAIARRDGAFDYEAEIKHGDLIVREDGDVIFEMGLRDLSDIGDVFCESRDP